MKRLWLVGVFCFFATWSYAQDCPEGFARAEKETETGQVESEEKVKKLDNVIQGETVRDTVAMEEREDAGEIPEEAFSAKNENFKYDPEIEQNFGGEPEAIEEEEPEADQMDPELFEGLDSAAYEYFNIPQDTTTEAKNQNE